MKTKREIEIHRYSFRGRLILSHSAFTRACDRQRNMFVQINENKTHTLAALEPGPAFLQKNMEAATVLWYSTKDTDKDLSV